MPDDHATGGDNAPREDSVPPGTPGPAHGEPPTLPTFTAGAGPRPMTIAGMPAVDVFGGVDGLFGHLAPASSAPSKGNPPAKVAAPPPPRTTPASTPVVTPPSASRSTPASTPSVAATSPIKPTKPAPIGDLVGLHGRGPDLSGADAGPDDEEFERSVGLVVAPTSKPTSPPPTPASPPPTPAAKTETVSTGPKPATIGSASPVTTSAAASAPPPKQIKPLPRPVAKPASSTAALQPSSEPESLAALLAPLAGRRPTSDEPPAGAPDTSPAVESAAELKAESPMAPPAPRSPVEERPRIGSPYEPPAVVIRSVTDTAPDTQPERASSDTPAETSEPTREPAGLPRPPRATMRMRPPSPQLDAGGVVPLPLLARPEGAPEFMRREDTGMLIDGLAEEIIAEAQREAATTMVMEPIDEPIATPMNPKRKWAIGFVGFALAASLVVALLPGDDSDPDDAATKDDTVEPEPDPALTNPLAALDPEPTPENLEPDPDPDPEPGEPEPVDDTPEPVPADDPTPKASKSSKTSKAAKDEPVSVTKDPDPKPKPKSDPAPKPAAPDTRDAKQLYDAAKSSYDKGKASEAYKLASASYKKGAKPKTAELMVLAACKLGDSAKAKSALTKVSGLRKAPMRKQCKSMGVSI